MDVIRKKRYRDKINYIATNIDDLSIIPRNSLEKKGIYYSLQTIIEATIDLVAMCVKDLGLEVKSDEEVFKRNI
ncbi:MAG: HepT-like ribonuclease domain-containing protein [Promethearchaeota archaeon]